MFDYHWNCFPLGCSHWAITLAMVCHRSWDQVCVRSFWCWPSEVAERTNQPPKVQLAWAGALAASHVNILKTIPFPNNNGSYGIRFGVCMASHKSRGSYAIFSVKVPFFDRRARAGDFKGAKSLENYEKKNFKEFFCNKVVSEGQSQKLSWNYFWAQ